MSVTVIAATERPLDVISIAAGNCYGNPNSDHKRVARCARNGHMSVFEHASATFMLEGVSRALMAQLTRHRLASFSIRSQRYCKLEPGTEWYVIPPKVRDSYSSLIPFVSAMEESERRYFELIDDGMKPEDARFVLGEAAKTCIVVTMNVRELFHVLDLRDSQHAQWEIRECAREMESAAMKWSDQWRELMLLRQEAVSE